MDENNSRPKSELWAFTRNMGNLALKAFIVGVFFAMGYPTGQVIGNMILGYISHFIGVAQ